MRTTIGKMVEQESKELDFISKLIEAGKELEEKEIFGLSGREFILATKEAEKNQPHVICGKTQCDCDHQYDNWINN